MQVPEELGEVTLRRLADICLRENARRLAPYDDRLLRPRLVPWLVRTALAAAPGGARRAAPA
jgi:hypothetical protein